MKNNIKTYREKLNLTQEELAKKSGVSRVVISQLENDSRDVITNKTMIKIAQALEKTVSEIFLI